MPFPGFPVSISQDFVLRKELAVRGFLRPLKRHRISASARLSLLLDPFALGLEAVALGSFITGPVLAFAANPLTLPFTLALAAVFTAMNCAFVMASPELLPRLPLAA